MGPEKLFENKVRKLLESNGAYVVKHFGCAFTKSGVPDLLVCLNGKFLAIEVKAEKGKASDLQLHNIAQIQASGGIAMVLYPKDFDKFKSFVLQLAHNK